MIACRWGLGAVLLLVGCSSSSPHVAAPTTSPVTTVRPATGSTDAAPATTELVVKVREHTAKVAFFYHPPSSTAGHDHILSDVSWLTLHRDDLADRDQLRREGYRRPIFVYLLAMQTATGHWDNNALWSDVADSSNPNSAYFDDALAAHPDWFLRDQYGQFIKNDYYWMDPGSAGWQTFFAAQARAVFDDGWDGLFLDNVAVTYKRPLRDARLNSVPSGGSKGDPVPWDYALDRPYTNASFGTAVQGLVDAVHTGASVPSGKPVWANLTDPTTALPDQREKYLPSLDGWMDEGFASTFQDTTYPTVDQWNVMVDRAELAGRMGKGQVLVGQGPKKDYELERFTYASFLLVTDGNTAFRYANTANYKSFWWYQEYELDFGSPTGPRRQLADGSWRRDFTRGYVVVDPATQTQKMVLDGSTV